MNRAEHLQWCKNRALQYLDNNAMPAAFASFVSDMGKHPDTPIMMPLLVIGQSFCMTGSLVDMRKWIEGFN